MCVDATMQQGAASGGGQGAANGSGQGAGLGAQIAEQIRQDLEAAQQAQAQAARDAAQGTPTPPAEPEVRIGGRDGPLVIRDGNGRETVIFEPGAIPPWIQDGPPEGVFMIPIALFASIAFVIVGLPIARAFARRMDRKAAPPVVGGGAELRQLQTSLDAMAVEIERISENQRFLTRVLADRDATGALPSPDAPNALRR